MIPSNTVEKTSWHAPSPSGGSYRLAQVGSVLLVKLTASPTPPMLAALSADIAIAHATAGGKLIYVAVIPKNGTAPTPETRPLMAEFARYVSQMCVEVHLVIEAAGFGGTILRSAITAVAMLSRERNLTVHGSIANVFGRVQSNLGPADAAELERAARRLGLVD